MIAEEIKRDVMLVKERNDDAAMKRLMEQYRPCVAKLALHYDRAHMEDAMQDGFIGLWAAVLKYDENKATLLTYVHNYVSGYILRGMTKRRNVKVSSAYRMKNVVEDENFTLRENTVSLDRLVENKSHIPSSPSSADELIIMIACKQRLEQIIEETASAYHPKMGNKNLTREMFVKIMRMTLGLEDGKRYRNKEIAEILELPCSAVKNRVKYCIEKVRADKEMKELYSELSA